MSVNKLKQSSDGMRHRQKHELKGRASALLQLLLSYTLLQILRSEYRLTEHIPHFYLCSLQLALIRDEMMRFTYTTLDLGCNLTVHSSSSVGSGDPDGYVASV